MFGNHSNMEQSKILRLRLRYRRKISLISALFGVVMKLKTFLMKLKTFLIKLKSFQFNIDFAFIICYTATKGVLYGFN